MIASSGAAAATSAWRHVIAAKTIAVQVMPRTTAVSEELAPALIEHVRTLQEAGEFRRDQPPEKVVGFISLVVNGIAVQMGSGERIRDVDALLEFVRTAVAADT